MASIEHAQPGDTDLLGDPDALNWAQRFGQAWEVTRRPRRLPIIGLAEAEFTIGAMLTWFASAIETGRLAQMAAEQEPVDEAVGLLMPAPGMVKILWNDGGSIAMVDTDRGAFADVALMNQLPRLLDEAMTKVRGDDGNDEI